MRLHDVEDVTSFAAGIAQSVVRANGGFLRPDQREDAVDFLVVTAYELASDYDPALTDSFRLYARHVLTNRMVDWYRKTLVDARLKTPRPQLVSLAQLQSHDEPTYRFEDEVLNRVELAR